jgi:hypothetical protein
MVTLDAIRRRRSKGNKSNPIISRFRGQRLAVRNLILRLLIAGIIPPEGECRIAGFADFCPRPALWRT